MFTDPTTTTEVITVSEPIYRFLNRHKLLSLLEPGSILPYQFLFDEEFNVETGNFGYIHGSYLSYPTVFNFEIFQSQSPYQKIVWQLHSKYTPELFNLDPSIIKKYTEDSKLQDIPTDHFITQNSDLILLPNSLCNLYTETRIENRGIIEMRDYDPKLNIQLSDL